MIYLDTSTFLKLYFLEAGSQTVQDAVFAQVHPLPVWDPLKAEMLNALQLKLFRKEISDKEAGHLTGLFDIRLRKGQYYSPEFDRYALMTPFGRCPDAPRKPAPEPWIFCKWPVPEITGRMHSSASTTLSTGLPKLSD